MGLIKGLNTIQRQQWALEKPNQIGYVYFDLRREGNSLAGGQSAGINNIRSILLNFLIRLRKRRPGQSHETSASRLEDTERTDQFEERVNTTGLGRPIQYSY